MTDNRFQLYNIYKYKYIFISRDVEHQVQFKLRVTDNPIVLRYNCIGHVWE